ncbi:Xanthine/uracil permease family protein isoform 1 [Hibiscus syriacus]|uniref:RING-type E3 ubiquitin transferase n=1 Tax=Hibiscus syriacus TaxID=106335 RepID=A0A6A3B0V8_HIBSY|nr:Xanthine/uracil permease family protein isoform 1 [Hibiscus syriacus]
MLDTGKEKLYEVSTKVRALSESQLDKAEVTIAEMNTRLTISDWQLNFSERLPLKSCGDWLNVYRGRINHSTVAIKMLSSVKGTSQEDFQAKVRLLTDIRHPHLVATMGFCSELTCMIYEYMHNAREVCMGLVFLHLAKPRPIVQGQLTTSNILLDCNLVAKISGYGLRQHRDYYDLSSDIWAFGVLLMQMLTGRNCAWLIEDAVVDRATLAQVLDEKAGNLPLELAVELAGISMKCMSVSHGVNPNLQIATVVEELDELKKKAEYLVARGGIEVVCKENVNM